MASSKQRRVLRFAAGAAWVMCGRPVAASAAALTAESFDVMANRCAPGVAISTLRGVATTESGLDPWTLHDNTTKVSEKPASLGTAVTIAEQWIGRGDSVDLGLMQINSENLSALAMTVRGALDPCASLAGGAMVLQAAYGGGKTSAERQAALLMALSRYNTGSPFKGILNGYARHVMATANAVAAPSSQPAAPAKEAPPAVPPAPADPNAPPAWNVWATAAYVKTHGAPWVIALSPAAAKTALAQTAPGDHPPPAPSAATAVASVQASTQQNQGTP